MKGPLKLSSEVAGLEAGTKLQKPFAQRIPDSVDWRNENGSCHVTGVKYQGPCGSCWAFATAAVIESANSIYKDQLEDLSVQQVGFRSFRIQWIQNTGLLRILSFLTALEFSRCSIPFSRCSILL